MAYTPQAKGVGFKAAVVPSKVQGLQENYTRQENAMAVYGQGLQQRAAAELDNAKQAGSEWKALADFSKSMKATAEAYDKRKKEEQYNRGLAIAYEEGVPQEVQEEYDESVAQLKGAKETLDNAAAQSLKNGAPYEVSRRIQHLSGWAEYGYATGKAQMAGESYQGWMSSQLATNDELELSIDGISFTPATASTTAQKAASMQALRSQFYKDYDLEGMNPVLLNKHAFPAMHKSDNRILETARRQIAKDDSFLERAQAAKIFGTDKDWGLYLDTIRNTVGADGVTPLGYKGAWDEGMKTLKGMIETGQMTELELEAIEMQEIPGRPGKTFGSEYGTQFAKLREALRAENINEWNIQQKQRQIQFQQAVDETRQWFLEDPSRITEANVRAAQDRLVQYGFGTSDVIRSLEAQLGTDAKQKREYEQEIERYAELGLLTPERLKGMPFDLQQKYGGIAQQQAKAAANDYSSQIKAFETYIKGKSDLSADSPLAASGTLALQEATSEFYARLANNLAAGMSPQQAANEAMVAVDTEMRAGAEDPNSKWYVSQDKMFPNLLTQYTQNNLEENKALERADNIRDLNSTVGPRAWDSPGLVWDKAELEAMEQGFGSPEWSMPSDALALGEQYSVDPFEIINRQREAVGLPALDIPAAREEYNTQVSPELQSMMNRWPSPQRSLRAWGGSGVPFSETRVPKGFGPTILQASAAHGIDPAILAGLIEQESSWNVGAVSSAGARGLGQFIPETAAEFGVDVSDPVSSINGAAKYLAYLRDYFKGDMRLAIIAYNGGMGNVERFGGPIPGNDENQNYYGLVMKGAAKYGAIGSGATSWKDPALMRAGVKGSWEVIEYLTGDITHEGYDPAHRTLNTPGDNYHEHIAFGSVDQARQAVKLLRSLKYNVTSTYRPGDPGYHGVGMAVDVALPHNIPHGDPREQEFSQTIRDLFGIK